MSAFASDARENGLLHNALYARDNTICCCGSSAAASAGLIRKNAASDVESRGVLIGAGFIAGESILGVLIAVLIVLNINLDQIFGIHELSQFFSLVFFAWFVGVFVWLATRALPDGGNLGKEIFTTATHSIKKFLRSLLPQSK